MRWFTAAMTMAALFGVNAVTRADAFDPRRVPVDAKWLLHVNVDAARDTKTWNIIDKKLENQVAFQKSIGQIEQLTGIQFPQSVHDVTIYGLAADEEAGVIIAHADVDQERLLNLLKNNPDYTVEEYRDYTIHHWKDHGKQLYGTFAPGRLTIIAHSSKNIQGILDALDGKAPSVKPDSALAAGAKPGILVYVAAGDLATLIQPPNPIIQQATSFWAAISEQADKFVLHGGVTAATPEAAEQMRTSLEGVRAILTLTANGENADPKLKMAASALATLNSKTDGKSVIVDWSVPLDMISGLVDAVAKPPARTPTSVPGK